MTTLITRPPQRHEASLAPRTITVPRLMAVAPGCLNNLPSHLAAHDFNLSQVCVASGSAPAVAFAESVVGTLEASDVAVVRATTLEGKLDEAAQLAAMIIENHVSLVLAVGGGRVIDTVKLAAARTQTEFISIPTTLAHDGISSPVASLLDRRGTRRSYAAVMPAGVLIDLDIVNSAPPRTIRAGVGDLASNLTAVMDWKLADRMREDRYDAFSAMLAEAAARPILELSDLQPVESREILAQGLLLSGFAMAAAGTSRPCSGAEHLISHALDHILGSGAAMHGEQVALGCLIAAAAHRSPLLVTFRRSFAALGVPCHPTDLNISHEQLAQALLVAPSARPERYTVLSELVAHGDDVRRLIDHTFEYDAQAVS